MVIPCAYNWLMCSKCELWFHCVCVSITNKKAKADDFAVENEQESNNCRM